jgi:hypothetical protein
MLLAASLTVAAAGCCWPCGFCCLLLPAMSPCWLKADLKSALPPDGLHMLLLLLYGSQILCFAGRVLQAAHLALRLCGPPADAGDELELLGQVAQLGLQAGEQTRAQLIAKRVAGTSVSKSLRW